MTTLILGGVLIDSQLGKDPWRLCKDYLLQCWSWGGQSTVNLGRIHQDFARIISESLDPGGSIDNQLGRICKDFARITSDSVDPGGCQSTVNLGRIHKDFARITSDSVEPGGGVDWQSTWEGSVKTLQGLPLTVLILGGVDWQSTWEGLVKTLQGLPLTVLIPGGWLTVNLGRVDWQSTWEGCVKTLQGLPLTVLILGGVLIDSQLGKDQQRLCKDYLWQCWSFRGQLTVNLGKDPQRLCKDYLWQCWSWGVDWQSTWEGSTKTLQGLPLTVLIRGGDQESTWEGSAKTLQGLPLTVLILGGVDQQSTWEGSADFVRITLDSVDPGVGGQLTVNLGMICEDCKDYLWQCWSWRVSIDSQLGEGLVKTCKDYLWQCWSLGGWLSQHGKGWLTVYLGRIQEDFARIAFDSVDPGRCWLTVNLGRISKDFARITSDSVDPQGVNWQSTWEGSTKTLQGLPLTVLILRGSIDSQLGKDPWRLCKDYLWQCWYWGVLINSQLGKDQQRLCKDYLGQCWSWGGGVNWQSTWEWSVKTLQGLPLTVLIPGGWLTVNLGRVNWQSTWEGSGRLCKDCLWQCWSWGGCWLTVNLGRISKNFARITSDSFDPSGVNWQSTWEGSTKTLQGLPLTVLILGGWLTVNLGRIHKDFARITSDSVDTGGVIKSQLGKDLQRLCKDYLWQCWSCRGVDQQSTWEGSAKTLQGLPWTVLILGWGSIDSQLGNDLWRLQGLTLTVLILGVNWQLTWEGSVKTARITSDSVDPGGCQLTVNLGKD